MLKAEVVRPTEFAKMMHIRKERYSRRHAGKHVVWLVADKYQQYLLVSQKLNWVKDFTALKLKPENDIYHQCPDCEVTHPNPNPNPK